MLFFLIFWPFVFDCLLLFVYILLLIIANISFYLLVFNSAASHVSVFAL